MKKLRRTKKQLLQMLSKDLAEGGMRAPIEYASELDITERGIHKALQELENDGVITTKRGNRKQRTYLEIVKPML